MHACKNMIKRKKNIKRKDSRGRVSKHEAQRQRDAGSPSEVEKNRERMYVCMEGADDVVLMHPRE